MNFSSDIICHNIPDHMQRANPEKTASSGDLLGGGNIAMLVS